MIFLLAMALLIVLAWLKMYIDMRIELRQLRINTKKFWDSLDSL